MAIATRCQTSGATYTTAITPGQLVIAIDFGRVLDLSAADAAELETNAHNALELVLARYWHEARAAVSA